MKTLRTLATVGIIGAVAAYASTAHAEQRSNAAVKIQLASTMNYAPASAPGGYKWERTSTETTTTVPAINAANNAPASAGYKWASAGESAQTGMTLIAERADRAYARTGVAGESGYKWGIRSVSDQAGYKWGIR